MGIYPIFVRTQQILCRVDLLVTDWWIYLKIKMTIKDIQEIAEEHGLLLSGDMKFNEMGIDFKVGFATDQDGKQWLLRIPRRNDLGEQIEKEKCILQLVKKHLSVQVPDWQIASPKLVAYPLLEDKPALTFDAITYEVTWNMSQQSPNYVPSLAKAWNYTVLTKRMLWKMV